jgi:hypothetical protein
MGRRQSVRQESRNSAAAQPHNPLKIRRIAANLPHGLDALRLAPAKRETASALRLRLSALASADEVFQRVAIALEFVHARLDQVTDADDSNEATIVNNRDMADPLIGHRCHQGVDAVI